MGSLIVVLHAMSFLYVRFKDETKESHQSILLTLFRNFTAIMFTVELV